MSSNFLYDNKNENLIERFLQEADGKTLHAIFVIDIDNFVAVNEAIGYDNGTDLLNRINTNITNLFRGTDIVVNTRGDEYIVLINNPGSITNVEALCEKIRQHVYSLSFNDINITASIGIALYPVHGTSYDELKAKAVQSLARIKADGKNGFRLYDAALTKTKFADIQNSASDRLDSSTKAIDSGEWKKYFDDICYKIFKADKNLSSSVNAIMEILCLYYGFGRAFVLTNKDDPDSIFNNMHFCIPGFEVPSTPAFDAIKKDLVVRLHESHGDYCIINVEDNDEDPEVISYMKTVEDSQLLYFSVYNQGLFLGVVFENTDSEKIELDDIDYLYKQIGEIFSYGMFIHEMNNSSDLMSKIELFENIDAYAYIIDKNTRTIKFMNKKAFNVAGTTAIGAKCHEVLCNSEAICSNCPLHNLKDDDSRTNARIQSFNFSARAWTSNLYSWLSLRDNPGIVLLISVEIDDFLDDIYE